MNPEHLTNNELQIVITAFHDFIKTGQYSTAHQQLKDTHKPPTRLPTKLLKLHAKLAAWLQTVLR